MSGLMTKQVLPQVSTESVEVLPLVKADLIAMNLDLLDHYIYEDMKARIDVGEAEYGKRLSTNNDRDFYRDFYEELLDASLHLRGAIAEKSEHYKKNPMRCLLEDDAPKELISLYFLTLQSAIKAKQMFLENQSEKIKAKIWPFVAVAVG